MEKTLALSDLFPVGKNCKHCRARFQSGIATMPGVQSATVTESSLIYVCAEDLTSEFILLGEDLVSEYGHAEWKIEGMDCTGCRQKIERTVNRVTGVSASQVNFIAQKLMVEYRNSESSSQVVQRAVENLGYGLKATQTFERLEIKPPALSTKESSLQLTPLSIEETPSARHASPKVATLPEQRWWKSPKGMHVFSAGLAYCAALVVSKVTGKGEIAFACASAFAGYPVARMAWKAALSGQFFTIEMLMSVAVVGALFIGAAEEAAMVVFLFAVGELLEFIATAKARSHIQSLLDLSPKVAWKVIAGKAVEVPADDLRISDLVEVAPGGRFPTDGNVEEGTSSADESHLTGESVPVVKMPGQQVFAGSLNGEGLIQFRVTKAVADNSVARILHLVEEAESQKAPTARFIDKFSRYYTPFIFIISLAMMILPPLLFPTEERITWIYRGLSLLLIGCPCALILSVPAAVSAAISSGARRGILIKGGAALEQIGKVKAIAFDKTGTLTTGKLEVTQVWGIKKSPQETLAIAAALELGSAHPLAKAIVSHAQNTHVHFSAAKERKALPGIGVEGILDQKRSLVCSMREATIRTQLPPDVANIVEMCEQQGQTTVGILTLENDTWVVAGLLALEDTLRPDAKESVVALQNEGIFLTMLTGDSQRAARKFAIPLGIAFEAELLPEQKWKAIQALKKQGMVAMVGDGINDAPALASADIGIAMGQGSDVALETANAVLNRNQLHSVVELVSLSKRAIATIRQNICVALGLKAAFLVTTILGMTGLWMAVLADTGATVLVTLNALLLLRNKK
jgi:Cd2+/Zn2+-exporting ATPase